MVGLVVRWANPLVLVVSLNQALVATNGDPLMDDLDHFGALRQCFDVFASWPGTCFGITAGEVAVAAGDLEQFFGGFVVET